MTPSEQCKQAGLKSLAELSRITGRSTRTLQHWAAHEPQFFAIVLAGATSDIKKDGDNDYAHWYCLSFNGKTIDSGRDANASIYVGFRLNYLTKAAIDNAKTEAGLTDDAVLLSASYLGLMPKKAFCD